MYDHIFDEERDVRDVREEIAAITAEQPFAPGEGSAFRELTRNRVPVLSEALDGGIFDEERDVRDVREETAAITAEQPFAPGEGSAFRKLTRNSVPVVPGALDGRSCQPGGRGAALGTYFEPPNVGFRSMTAISWRIVAPRYLGGTSGDLLFVTSSNHTARGAEALVSYYNNEEAQFRVWDWAHPKNPDPDIGRFVVALPYSRWRGYEIRLAINGAVYGGLHVVNGTRFDGTRWRNDVFLYNSTTNTLDLVWSYSHDWDTSAECPYLFFGPCIEPKGHGHACGARPRRRGRYRTARPASRMKQRLDRRP